MPLRINGTDGSFVIPNVLSRIYAFRPFADKKMTFRITSNGKTQTKEIDVKGVIEHAWRFVRHAAAYASSPLAGPVASGHHTKRPLESRFCASQYPWPS